MLADQEDVMQTCSSMLHDGGQPTFWRRKSAKIRLLTEMYACLQAKDALMRVLNRATRKGTPWFKELLARMKDFVPSFCCKEGCSTRHEGAYYSGA
jgi:hypothetical protein